MLAGSCPKVVYKFLGSRICCRDLGSFAPNDKHSFGRMTFCTFPLQLQKWHPCKWQEGWLASQAKTTTVWFLASNSKKYCTGHENVKSTMLKPDLPQHKPEPPTTSHHHFVALRNLFLVAGWPGLDKGTLFSCSTCVEEPYTSLTEFCKKSVPFLRNR